jgi:hypothetical protein
MEGVAGGGCARGFLERNKNNSEIEYCSPVFGHGPKFNQDSKWPPLSNFNNAIRRNSVIMGGKYVKTELATELATSSADQVVTIKSLPDASGDSPLREKL